MHDKLIQRLFEIPDYIISKIDKDVSINSFINQAISNNIDSDISLIRVSKKTHTIPTRVRIKSSVYEQLKDLIDKYNVSMQKLVIHFLLSELEK